MSEPTDDTTDALHERLSRTFRIQTWTVGDDVSVRLVDDAGVNIDAHGATILDAFAKAARKAFPAAG